jgi:hypothetical protein
MAQRWSEADEAPHPGAVVEEWLFTVESADGSFGLVHGQRIRPDQRRAWYWAALVRSGAPVLHVAEWDVAMRANPLIVKSEALWAEVTCDDPMRQWTVGNELVAAALDDPEDALGRAYGTPTPLAWDLEWYATGPPDDVPHGYTQRGVVHGVIELVGGPIELVEQPARRWRRWGEALGPVELDPAVAHDGLRAAFAFPDGTRSDWVLTPSGWRARA